MPVPPFSDAEIVKAFSEYVVSTPFLGCGSFKVAYRASDANGDQVIKILTEALPVDLDKVDSDDLPDRFARELVGMGAIDSPYVVKLLSSPEVRQIGASSHVWYAEPYYTGGTLEEALSTRRFSPDQVTFVVGCLLQAVAQMWDAKIVHRDIKPGNIVFDEEGTPVLLDLGIAFFSNLTAITDALGPSPRTPVYAAPEQFEIRRNATIDFRTDLFQVGLVALEMLTGKHPFLQPSDDMATYYRRLIDFDKTSLDDVAAAPGLKNFISRCLAARPSGRFRTISSARAALEGNR